MSADLLSDLGHREESLVKEPGSPYEESEYAATTMGALCKVVRPSLLGERFCSRPGSRQKYLARKSGALSNGCREPTNSSVASATCDIGKTEVSKAALMGPNTMPPNFTKH